jgi:hypothetical protein
VVKTRTIHSCLVVSIIAVSALVWLGTAPQARAGTGAHSFDGNILSAVQKLYGSSPIRVGYPVSLACSG